MEISKVDRLRVLQRHADKLSIRLEHLGQISNRWSWARVLAFLGTLIFSTIALFGVGAWLFALLMLLLGSLFTFTIFCHSKIDTHMRQIEVLQQIVTQQIARMRLEWEEIPLAIFGPRYEHPFEADLDIVGPRSIHRLVDTTVTQQASERLRDWLTITVPDAEMASWRQRLVAELMPLSLFRNRLHVNGTLAAEAEIQRGASTQATLLNTLRANRQTKVESALEASDESNGTEVQPAAMQSVLLTDRPVWDANVLLLWLKAGPADSSLLWRLILLGVLALINIVLFIYSWLFGGPAYWPYTLGLYALFSFYTLMVDTGALAGSDMFTEATDLQGQLTRLSRIFRQFEGYSYRSTPLLRELCEPFLDPQNRPSQHLRKVDRIVNATGIRGNPLIWVLLNVLVPWDIFFAYLLSRYRHELAQSLPTWLDRWFTVEALLSLANLGYLNPHYTMPIIGADSAPCADESTGAEPKSGAVFAFEARQLGHPLLVDVEAEHAKVSNDFTFAQLGDVALLTGSNMSGKSTFLKAMGVNLALAFAGSPVDAQVLRTPLYRIFTSIKVTDSVTDGISYFYAEVRRLKALLIELEDPESLPLFFCIDEIFRGTNNRERLIGSRSLIKELSGKHGVGAISTHDLELVKLADEAPQIENFHFRDDVQDGEMIFDYTIRSGPCPTTNALKIMALAGLPVDEQ